MTTVTYPSDYAEANVGPVLNALTTYSTPSHASAFTVDVGWGLDAEERADDDGLIDPEATLHVTVHGDGARLTVTFHGTDGWAVTDPAADEVIGVDMLDDDVIEMLTSHADSVDRVAADAHAAEQATALAAIVTETRDAVDGLA